MSLLWHWRYIGIIHSGVFIAVIKSKRYSEEIMYWKGRHLSKIPLVCEPKHDYSIKEWNQEGSSSTWLQARRHFVMQRISSLDH